MEKLFIKLVDGKILNCDTIGWGQKYVSIVLIDDEGRTIIKKNSKLSPDMTWNELYTMYIDTQTSTFYSFFFCVLFVCHPIILCP